jgi:hypothetical protein
MSIPRYIIAESTLMMSQGKCFTKETAKSVLPDAVGPIKKMQGVIKVNLSFFQAKPAGLPKPRRLICS